MKVFMGIALIALAACVSTTRAQVPVCEPGVDYYPHPTNCNLYYQCSGGVAIEQACPPGLYWDAVEEICDFPNDSGCDDTPTTTARTTSTGPPTETEPTTTTTGLPTEGPTTTGLPTEGPTSTGIPTEGPTSTGIPTEGTTTSSLPTEGTTTSDVPTEGSSTTGIPTEGTSGVPTEPNPTTTSSPEPSTEPPGGLPNSCPPVDDPDHIVRLPHETNCEYYYRCMNGTRGLFSCALDSSQHFSPTLRICQPADVAGCDRCPPVDDVSHVVRLPHETDCHRYYLCQDGLPEPYQCREDLHFSRDVRDCLKQEEAKCTL